MIGGRRPLLRENLADTDLIFNLFLLYVKCLKSNIENKTTSEVKRPTLIVTKFFINKQDF